MKVFLSSKFYLTCFLLLSIGAHATSLDKKIDALIHQRLPNATVGVYIENLDGKPIYAHQANALFYPASNIKLYTAAAALSLLGADYRYATKLSRLQDNFYITFSGAPDLTADDLDHLLQRVSPVIGDIILDTTRFKAPFYLAGSSYDDLGWYYTAPCHAVILNRNAVDYTVLTKTNGHLIQLTPKKKEEALNLVNEVITVDPLVEKQQCPMSIDLQPANTLHLFGCLGKQEQPISMSFGVPDPVFLAKKIIAKGLEKYHVSLGGQIKVGHTPSKATLIAAHQSAPLKDLLAYMLKNSDNLYADSFTRTIGQVLTSEGTTKQGTYAIKQILSEAFKMDMLPIELSDGVGTRYNLSSPKHIVTLLSHVYHHPQIRSIFMNSLPIMGLSGSLIDRMKGTLLENKVFAKTGSMHDVSALSGFIKTPNDRMLIFSIVINGIHTDINQAKKLENDILLLVAKNFRQRS